MSGVAPAGFDKSRPSIIMVLKDRSGRHMAPYIDDRERRERIARSQERSRGYGIDHRRVVSARIVSGPELARRLEAGRPLLAAAEPFIEQLYSFVEGSGFFVLLTDGEGCILKVLGDEAILAKATSLEMVPGAFMDEANIGTNAMGTALAEDAPVQISGDEHFVAAYHRWTCSGAPIHDAEGRIIGSLDLTGNRESVHPHTLGMVVAAAEAIGRFLRIERANEELAIAKQYEETIIESLSAGIVTADMGGQVRTASRLAAEMFGYRVDGMRRMKVGELVDGWDRIRESLAAGRPFQEEDLSVNARSNKVRFSVSAYPLVGTEGETREAVLVFKELRRVRKLANKIMGRQAIYTFDKIVGEDETFRRVLRFARKAACSRSTVLILGESGTGKELFAQAMHNESERRDEPFVAINCGAIPRTLVESELFGYEEGAFTGAKRAGQAGKFEIADGGTVFLDEICEMPLDLQTRLLRVIEEGTICRVGGTHDIPVDVRVMAASNKDLREEVERGNFRKDLYYRLNVLPLVLPPLRERRGDIPVLIEYFMGRISRKLNKKPVRLPEPYLRGLVEYAWPGNVRELENLVELMINVEDIVPLPGAKRVGEGAGGASPAGIPDDILHDTDEALSLAEVEKRHIERTLRLHNGNISEAALVLGIGRTTLYRKIEAMGIAPRSPE